MALRWVEGFEIDQHATYMDRKYAEAAGMSSYQTGRLHGKCLASVATTEFRPPSFGLQTNWILGFGLKHPGASIPSALDDVYFVFRRGAEETLRLQFVKENSTQFKFQLKRGSTILDTSALYDVGQWHWFELNVTLHTSTGAYEFRHNESLDFSDTGANTAESGLDDGADVLDFQFLYSSFYLDDIYLCDGSGGENDDFRGDSVVEGRLPTGDGSALQWTKSTGATHYALLDDPATAPADSDYVSSSTVGHEDLLTFDALSFITGQIFGVMVSASIKLDAAGSRTVDARVRSGGSTYAGDTWAVASTLYNHFTSVFELDPDTAALWTVGGVDAAEFGMKVAS